MLLVYAVLRHDTVFILGQSTGFIVYIRNICLIKSERENKTERLPEVSAGNL